MASVSVAERDFHLLRLSVLLGGGTLSVYEGAAPVDADTPISAQVLIATFTLGSPAFGSPSNGLVVANAIAPVLCVASGTPSFARLTGGATVDCTVGITDAEILLPKATWALGELMTIAALTMFYPAGS